MKKLRIEVIAYVCIAIVAGSVIWIKGDLFWLDTETKKYDKDDKGSGKK